MLLSLTAALVSPALRCFNPEAAHLIPCGSVQLAIQSKEEGEEKEKEKRKKGRVQILYVTNATLQIVGTSALFSLALKRARSFYQMTQERPLDAPRALFIH
jgi:hypothetical protein